MNIPADIRFCTTNWKDVPAERHEGTTGFALWRVQHFGNIRVRQVEYSPGYLADHWCDKGHIIFCIAGSMTTALKDGRTFDLYPGMSYQVGDQADAHRTSSKEGVTLFIVD